MWDAAIDTNMIVSSELDVHFLSNFPSDINNAKQDFNDFAEQLYILCKEDNGIPMFNVPIKDGRCASVFVEKAEIPTQKDIVLLQSQPLYEPHFYTFKIIKRGVERQIKEGICPDSPFSHEYGRKRFAISNMQYNMRLLKEISYNVSSIEYDPFLYLAQIIHSNGISIITILYSLASCITSLFVFTQYFKPFIGHLIPNMNATYIKTP